MVYCSTPACTHDIELAVERLKVCPDQDPVHAHPIYYKETQGQSPGTIPNVTKTKSTNSAAFKNAALRVRVPPPASNKPLTHHEK